MVARWVIRDNRREISTGFGESDYEAAKIALDHYVAQIKFRGQDLAYMAALIRDFPSLVEAIKAKAAPAKIPPRKTGVPGARSRRS
jgi:hypothetical protein